MSINIELRTDRVLRALAERSRQTEEGARRALEGICRAMVNYIKDNGPWTDRTGNLRNSIDHVIDPTPGVIRGTVFAGMNYAVYVEYKEGYWVLSGGVEYIRPILKDIFKDQFKVGGVTGGGGGRSG